MNLHRFVRRAWQGEGGAAGSLYRGATLPLELLFRLGVAVRTRRYDTGGAVVHTPRVPVISVGNLAVGGTGKTPIAAWVVGLLREAGRRPALLARGYGTDELLLHERWNPGTPVVADPDRVTGVETAVEKGADVVVLDDGFQHRRLGRDLDVVLLAAEEGWPERLLPRGPFREGAAALHRAHGVVVTRKTADAPVARRLAERVAKEAPGALLAQLHLRPGPFRRLRGEGGGGPRGPVLVATGVARPGAVSAGVLQLGVAVSGTEVFPDHHDFTDRDVRELVDQARGRPLVVTEKDAVKLERLKTTEVGEFWVLGQTLEWESGEEELAAGIRAVGGES